MLKTLLYFKLNLIIKLFTSKVYSPNIIIKLLNKLLFF